MTETKSIQTRVGQEKAPTPIRRCIECGRPLQSDQEAFDRPECEELNLKKTKAKKKSKNGKTETSTTDTVKPNNKTRVFWLKGDGAVKREANIDLVKELILEGLTYPDILRFAIKSFRSRTISEYYDIASEEIESEKGDMPHG